jgi:hypothetical protein
MANILHFCFCCRLARSYIKKLDIRKKIIIQGHEEHEESKCSGNHRELPLQIR